MLFDYLCIEKCRLCHTFINPDRSIAKTVCDKCWIDVAKHEPKIDFTENKSVRLMVAHAVPYEQGIKRLIYKLKYDQDRLIACDLALLLKTAFEKLGDSNDQFMNSLLIPIPLSWWRKIKRGFNQAELLATRTARLIESADVANNILKRKRHTRAQHLLSKVERAENLIGAFTAKKAIDSSDRRQLILVDDIHTTGATLIEAARELSNSGFTNLAAITVARANLSQHNSLGF